MSLPFGDAQQLDSPSKRFAKLPGKTAGVKIVAEHAVTHRGR
jgi:hypothetical protein